jgi:hypothetical protein
MIKSFISDPELVYCLDNVAIEYLIIVLVVEFGQI